MNGDITKVSGPFVPTSQPMDPAEFIRMLSKALMEASDRSSSPLKQQFALGGMVGGGMPLGGMVGGGMPLGNVLSSTINSMSYMNNNIGGSFSDTRMASFGSMQGSYADRVTSLGNMSVDTMFMLVMGERQKALKQMMQMQMQDYRDQTQQLKELNKQLEGLRDQSAKLGAAASAASAIPVVGQCAGAAATQAKTQVDNKIETLKDKRTEITSQQQQDMMRIQDTMQKYSQAAEQSTNILKKCGDTMSQIISNMK